MRALPPDAPHSSRIFPAWLLPESGGVPVPRPARSGFGLGDCSGQQFKEPDYLIAQSGHFVEPQAMLRLFSMLDDRALFHRVQTDAESAVRLPLPSAPPDASINVGVLGEVRVRLPIPNGSQPLLQAECLGGRLVPDHHHKLGG